MTMTDLRATIGSNVVNWSWRVERCFVVTGAVAAALVELEFAFAKCVRRISEMCDTYDEAELNDRFNGVATHALRHAPEPLREFMLRVVVAGDFDDVLGEVTES